MSDQNPQPQPHSAGSGIRPTRRVRSSSFSTLVSQSNIPKHTSLDVFFLATQWNHHHCLHPHWHSSEAAFSSSEHWISWITARNKPIIWEPIENRILFQNRRVLKMSHTICGASHTGPALLERGGARRTVHICCFRSICLLKCVRPPRHLSVARAILHPTRAPSITLCN